MKKANYITKPNRRKTTMTLIWFYSRICLSLFLCVCLHIIVSEKGEKLYQSSRNFILIGIYIMDEWMKFILFLFLFFLKRFSLELFPCTPKWMYWIKTFLFLFYLGYRSICFFLDMVYYYAIYFPNLFFFTSWN